jgi:leucyl aminopeptidase
MKVTVSSNKPASSGADVLVVPLWSDGKLPELPASLKAAMRQQIRRLSFKGSWGSAEFFGNEARGVRASFIAVAGLGEKDRSLERQAEGMRRSIARVVREMGRVGVRHLAVVLPAESEAADRLAAAVVDGAVLTSYRFTEYSAQARRFAAARQLKQVTLLVAREQAAAVRDAAERAETVLRGVELVRELVNQPASRVTPRALVEEAERIERASKRISLRVLDRAQASTEGFNAFLAVGRGSTEEPYVIHLTYTPRARAGTPPRKKVFLVGKGITFDSGGLSLKPADYMEAMKIDMAGAAAVLGVFSILPKLLPEVEVHGVIGACENMPSGSAFRPGDILTAKNGKTIEVLNTDAEGRVTLADTLAYAAEHKPNAVVDLATLTGACMVALGDTYAGLWSTDEKLSQSLLAAAEKSGEGLALLPLPDEYQPMIESKVADVRNTATSRWGGAITAALFLREFTGEVPWAHIDIAGPAHAEREWLPYYGVGATGYGVRTLINFLEGYTDSAS